MENGISIEKINLLTSLCQKNYNDFTLDEINEIHEQGKDITFQDVISYLEYLDDHGDIAKSFGENAEEKLAGIVASLYTCDQIVDLLSGISYYSDIPKFVNFRIEKGVEPDYVINYDRLLRLCIDDNKPYEILALYNYAYEKLDEKIKKEVFEYVYSLKEYNYLSNGREKGVADLLKFGKKFSYDIAKLWPIVGTTLLIELCTNEEDEILNTFYEIAEEKEKYLIDSFKRIKDSEIITYELFEEIISNVEDSSIKSSIAEFAVKKGYVPPVENFNSHIFNDDSTKKILINKNLVYYILTKNDYSSNYFDKNIYDSLESPELKQIFNIIKDYKPGSSYSYNSAKYLPRVKDLLDVKNIHKYFDGEEIKYEFLQDLTKDLVLDLEVDNSFLLFALDKTIDKVPTEDKSYYDYLRIILKLNNLWWGFVPSEITTAAESKEKFAEIMKNEETVIQFIKNNPYYGDITLILVKANLLTENIIKQAYPSHAPSSLELIKELMDKDCESFDLFRNINCNKNLFDENGPKKDALIKYLLKNNYIEETLLLSEKYVSKNQNLFIQIAKEYFAKNYLEDTEKTKELISIINDPEQLNSFIVDNKPTSKFVDKLFEIGAIYCFEGHEDILTDKQKLAYEVYKNISSKELQEVFCDFIASSSKSILNGDIPEDTIKKIPELLDLIKLSNSSEVSGRYINIARLILQNTNENKKDPLVQFRKIEKIFLTKNLSHMDKIFRSFQLLYPHEKLIKTIRDSYHVSPTLKKYATSPEETILGKEALRIYGDYTYAVEMIMYSDLLKTTLASNDKTFIDYIDSIEKGNNIFKALVTNEKEISELTADEKYILNTYVYHLEDLYNNTHPGSNIKMNKDLERNLNILISLYKTENVDLIPDQIITNKYYAYIGISSLAEMKDIITRSKQEAHQKGLHYAKQPLELEIGDCVKGIGNITYFDTIIQNGSVSKEFLGGDVDSDLTPFDTDLSIVTEKDATNIDTRSRLEANGYGPIFFVIKGALNKYNCTRDKDGTTKKIIETREEFEKVELFRTLGDNHFGIRTGFASTQVDYIICDDKLLVDKIGLVLAKNGFYVPVVDKEGKIIYTPEQYEHLRNKMGGLSYYNVDSFEVSSTVTNDFTLSLVDAIRENIEQTQRAKSELEEKLRTGFAASGLVMKTQIDGDMHPGSVELIDTGSTGRGTNQIGDGDFDFTIRLDRILIQNQEKTNEVARRVCAELGIVEQSGDLRKAMIPLSEKEVELDISYTSKSDRITYTTDMSLADRLNTIKKQDPEQHVLILSNIVLAKTLLKKGECYKPHHASQTPQGGLGGVGTENWILQNGGSLEEAATEFLIASGVMKIEITEDGKKEIVIDETAQKEYDSFKTSYSIWDFGQNQLAEKRSRDFPYDNFIWNNMNSNGYGRMVKTMQTYMLELHPEIKFVPKPVPAIETEAEKDERESLEEVSTNVRNLLQGLKQTNVFGTDSISETKGK